MNRGEDEGEGKLISVERESLRKERYSGLVFRKPFPLLDVFIPVSTQLVLLEPLMDVDSTPFPCRSRERNPPNSLSKPALS